MMDPHYSDHQQSQPLIGSGHSTPDTSHNASYESLPEHGHRPQFFPQPSDDSQGSSPSHFRSESNEGRFPKEKPRVRFGADSAEEGVRGPTSYTKPKKSSIVHGRSPNGSGGNSPQNGSWNGTHSPTHSSSVKQLLSSEVADDVTEESPSLTTLHANNKASREPISPLGGGDGAEDTGNEPLSSHVVGEMAAQNARTRAELLSQSLGSSRKTRSAPTSPASSPKSSPPSSPNLAPHTQFPNDLTDIMPLEKLENEKNSRKFGIDDPDSEDEGDKPKKKSNIKRISGVARRLVDSHLIRDWSAKRTVRADSLGSSGQSTPEHEKDFHYISKPDHFRQGILGGLLSLYGQDAYSRDSSHSLPVAYRRSSKDLRELPMPQLGTPGSSPPSSGQNTPKRKVPKWNAKNSWGGASTASLSSLVNSSTSLTATGAAPGSRPSLNPRHHSGGLNGKERRNSRRGDFAIEIRKHVEDVIARQEYLVKSCRALMRYGAPTHRLEEYMKRSARALQVSGQFLYIPGCMLISFDDLDTHTTKVKLVRETQGINLGKLVNMHDIYKAIIHDKMTAQEASESLEELDAKEPKFSRWVVILAYGFASATVGPFAFSARLIDMPVTFVLGCILGILQLVVAPKSESYTNVFEVTAAVVTSFLARAIGTIKDGDGNYIFCFPALAQSAICLILPGYLVFNAACELQSKYLVAGSVRMVYAIIYSLFLGFGILVGVSLFGAMDPNASSELSCPAQPFPEKVQWAFVPPFTFFMTIINQAHWREMPLMIVVAFAGYIVNFWSTKLFSGNQQVADTVGAFTVGVLGNIYSRFFHGMSAATILPAIFVQVPSGLAASGGLISGVVNANEILKNSSSAASSKSVVDTSIFNVGYSMIQIAVGLTVGLFLSSLVMYPFGKKRSGLFSF